MALASIDTMGQTPSLSLSVELQPISAFIALPKRRRTSFAHLRRQRPIRSSRLSVLAQRQVLKRWIVTRVATYLSKNEYRVSCAWSAGCIGCGLAIPHPSSHIQEWVRDPQHPSMWDSLFNPTEPATALCPACGWPAIVAWVGSGQESGEVPAERLRRHVLQAGLTWD